MKSLSKKLPEIIRESMILVGGIMIILGVSLASTNYLIDTEVPTRIFEFIQQHIDDKLTFLILLNIFLLLLLGMMLDIFSALVIIVPIILPVAIGYGIHPVHLGIIFPGQHAVRLFHPTGRHEFIYRQLSIWKTRNDIIQSDDSILFNSTGCRPDYYLLASVKSLPD